MKAFSLSTCLTAALMIFCFQINARADAQVTQGDCSNPQTEAMKTACAQRINRQNELLQEQINELRKKNLLGDCKTQSESFNKALGEFNSSCGSAVPALKRLTSIIGSPAKLDCAHLVNQCEQCGTHGRCNANSDLLDESGDEEPSASSNTVGTGGGSEGRRYREDLIENLKSCQSPSGDEYSSARDALKDYRKERAKLEERVRDSQLDITKVAQSQTEAKNKLDDQAEALQLRMEEKQRALKAAAKEREGKIKEALLKIEAEVKSLEINMERLKLSMVEADVTLAEALTQFDNQCHATALAKVEEHRKQVLKAIESSTYTPGGQGNLFSGVGKSMKAKFKKLAADYFKECQSSELTRNLKNAARNRKGVADARAQAEIKGMQDAIKRMQDQAKELQSNERTALLQEQMEAMQALSKEAEANYKKLERRRGEIASEAGMKMMEAGQKLTQAQADLAREARDIEMDEAVVSLGKRLGLSRSGDKGEAIAKASRDHFLLMGVAGQAAEACCIDNKDAGTGPATANCKRACSYIGAESTNIYGCDPGAVGTGGTPKSSDGSR